MIYSNKELSEKGWASGITSHEQVSLWWLFSVSFLWKWKQTEKKSLGKRSSYGETPAEANSSYKNILKGKIQISKARENDFQPVDAMGFVGCFSGYIDKYADKPQVFLWHAHMCLRPSWKKSRGLRINSTWNSLSCTINAPSKGIIAHSNISWAAQHRPSVSWIRAFLTPHLLDSS